MLKCHSPEIRRDAATAVGEPQEDADKGMLWEVESFQVHRVDNCDASLGPGRYLATIYPRQEYIIIESHWVTNLTGPVDCGRLRDTVQSLHDINQAPRQSIPSCVGYLHDSIAEYSLIFRPAVPLTIQHCHFDSLESVIHTPTHPSHEFLKSTLHKARVASSVAWGLHAIHQAGYSHKSVGLHNILIHTTTQPDAYLMGFDLATFHPTTAHVKQISATPEWRDRLYQHPQCEEEENFRFRRKYDYYALGVVILELGWMQSFHLLNGDLRLEVEAMSADRLQWFRTQMAKELVGSVGEEYVSITLLCLNGEFGIDEEDVGENFKIKVCEALDRLVASLDQ